MMYLLENIWFDKFSSCQLYIRNHENIYLTSKIYDYLPNTIKKNDECWSTKFGLRWNDITKRSLCHSCVKRMTSLWKKLFFFIDKYLTFFIILFTILSTQLWCIKLTCSHSRSINASNPLTVLQSGLSMIWAREVTHNVISLPSDPWTSTDDLS